MYLAAIISLLYITSVEYYGYIPIAQLDWRSQNALAYFYPYLLFVIIMDKFKINNQKIIKMLREVSKATFHIYLIQMFYFWSGCTRIVSNLLKYNILVILANLIACISIGMCFYKCENYLRKKIILNQNLAKC